MFVLAGPATSPLVPEAPPPPVKVKIAPVLLPEALVVPPAVAVWSQLELKTASLLPGVGAAN